MHSRWYIIKDRTRIKKYPVLIALYIYNSIIAFSLREIFQVKVHNFLKEK